MNISFIHLYIPFVILQLMNINSSQVIQTFSEHAGPTLPPGEYCHEVCGFPPMTDYILNGDKVEDRTKYPWIIGLIEKKNPNHLFCSGMLISDKYAITAGHCIDVEENRMDKNCMKEGAGKECYRPPESIFVGLLRKKDSDDVEPVEVQRIIPHPKYTPKTFIHDIALVELKENVKCKLVARPICLPHKNMSKIGQSLIISGWGKYDHNVSSKQKLMEGKVNQVIENKCELPTDKDRKIICALGNQTDQASCQGDSGSAIFASFGDEEQYFALGVTSLGPPDCSPKDPDSYTDVYAYRKWIRSVTKKKLPKSLSENKLNERRKKGKSRKGKGNKKKKQTANATRKTEIKNH